jgi:hypothetical protein
MSGMLLEKYTRQQCMYVFQRLGGIKWPRSPWREALYERREPGGVVGSAVAQNLEWSMARSHGIVWSKVHGAMRSNINVPEYTSHATTCGGHATRVWRRQSSISNFSDRGLGSCRRPESLWAGSAVKEWSTMHGRLWATWPAQVPSAAVVDVERDRWFNQEPVWKNGRMEVGSNSQ